MEKFAVVTPIKVLNYKGTPYFQNKYRICSIFRNASEEFEKGETVDTIFPNETIVYDAVTYELEDGYRTEFKDEKGNQYVVFDHSENNFLKVGTKGEAYAKLQASLLNDIHYDIKQLQYRLSKFEKGLTFSTEED